MYEKITDSSTGCDLCGTRPADAWLYRDERHLCVCAECKKKLEEMPKGIRENLEKYLIGNVV